MTMINFYVDRGGKELRATKKAVFERANASLRRRAGKMRPPKADFRFDNAPEGAARGCLTSPPHSV